MSTRLPIVLENIRIASPCAADWDDMRGGERVRFCGRCQKNVYNLSSMTRADAEELVSAKEGRLCVRFFQRSDGTMLTADCPVGAQRLRWRARVWASMSSAAASAALLVGLVGGRSARADVTVPQKSDKPAATARGDGGGTHGGLKEPPVRMMGKVRAPEAQDKPAKL